MKQTDHPAAALAASRFDSTFVDTLPGDAETSNVCRQVTNACYSRVLPTPVRAPRLLAWSQDCARWLGLRQSVAEDDSTAAILAGNQLLPSMQPYAARYGGHQFGTWAGQLGDGRAITLGELRIPGGGRVELQLKGAGRTPYSRSADGRAVLRSSIREFLCSEAMHHLGVPTTRALGLLATGESVIRDMFYDGHPQSEPGAIVCRVAASFVRFGNFEIHCARGEIVVLRQLAEYVIRSHFPGILPAGPAAVLSPAVLGNWFEEICRRTGVLMAHWMRVGFVHGVMNTDNMSVLGLTIDYGPYGWLEGYDPHWTPNTTDLPGRRYAYANQPQIAAWNLARLAQALHPLIEDVSLLESGLTVYARTFTSSWRDMLAQKLGLIALDREADETLVAELFGLLQQTETDMTLFFRNLARVRGEDFEPLRAAFYDERVLDTAYRGRLLDWLARYAARGRDDPQSDAARTERMNRANPKYVLRNYLAQQAIDAAQGGDPRLIRQLLLLLEAPYDEQPQCEALAQRRPDWAKDRPGCSALSCSS